MQQLEYVEQRIKDGYIFSINSCPFSGVNAYCGSLVKFNGMSIVDIQEVDPKAYLDYFHEIRNQLLYNKILQVTYNFNSQKFASCIIEKIRTGGYKEPYERRISEGLQTEELNLLSSLLSLNDKIANKEIKLDKKVKEIRYE